MIYISIDRGRLADSDYSTVKLAHTEPEKSPKSLFLFGKIWKNGKPRIKKKIFLSTLKKLMTRAEHDGDKIF